MQSIIQYLDNYTPQILVFEIAVLTLVFVTIIVIWVMNRKKFHNLKHQVPAAVVNDYLNSIIQNSNALKSSLFRGGGVDGIPSVIPVSGIPGGDSLMMAGDATAAELTRKNAEIASLQSQLSVKNQTVSDLEKKLKETENKLASSSAASSAPSVDVSDYEKKITTLEEKIMSLEAMLAAAKEGGSAAPVAGGDDSALRKQLEEVTRERDELKDRLQEYGIIEDDLANLKRLQQENAQLRKSLESMGGDVDAVVAAIPASGSAKAAPIAAAAAVDAVDAVDVGFEEPAVDEVVDVEAESEVPEEFELPAVEEEAEEAVADIPTLEDEGSSLDEGVAASSGEEKSPEDLLSEFEKMLG